MNGSGTRINTPYWDVEHLKSDIRATTWCGERYDIGAARETPRSGKPECAQCRKIEDGDAPYVTAPPLFGRGLDRGR